MSKAERTHSLRQPQTEPDLEKLEEGWHRYFDAMRRVKPFLKPRPQSSQKPNEVWVSSDHEIQKARLKSLQTGG